MSNTNSKISTGPESSVPATRNQVTDLIKQNVNTNNLSSESKSLVISLASIKKWVPKVQLVNAYNNIMNDIQRIPSSKSKLKELKEELQRVTYNQNAVKEQEANCFDTSERLAWMSRMVDVNKDVMDVNQRIKALQKQFEFNDDKSKNIELIINNYSEYVNEASSYLENTGADAHFNVNDILVGADLSKKINNLTKSLETSLNNSNSISKYIEYIQQNTIKNDPDTENRLSSAEPLIQLIG